MPTFTDETGPHLLPLVAKGMMLRELHGKRGIETVDRWAEANGLPLRAHRILKAAQAAAISGNAGYAGALLGNDGDIATGAWAASLRTSSVFFRLKADAAFTPMPLRRKVAISTVGATAALVAEGVAKPLTAITLVNQTLSPTKCAAILVATADLVADLSSEAQSLFAQELKGAVSAEVDREFFRQIGTGTAIAGSADPWADLKAALAAVDLRGTSRPYWIGSPAAQKALAMYHATGGQQSFEGMTAAGSCELFGIPFLPTDALVAGSLVLLNAASVAAGSTEVDLAASNQADIAMNTTPGGDASTGAGTTMTSLWQTNSIALRAECSLALEVLRTGCIATISGATW